jgi:hypothetical protein
MFADGTLRPLWRSFCEAFAVLLPNYQNARLWFDDRDIAFLRQDRTEVAEIQNQQAATINSYIQAGWTPESSVAAVKENDITLLKHTGLFSVQLQPPMPEGPDANTPGAPDEGANKPDDEGSNPAPDGGKDE